MHTTAVCLKGSGDAHPTHLSTWAHLTRQQCEPLSCIAGRYRSCWKHPHSSIARMWRSLCLGSCPRRGRGAHLSGLQHRMRQPLLPRTKTNPTTTIATRRQCSGQRSKPEAPPSRPPVPPPPPPRKPTPPETSLLLVYLKRYTTLLESRPLATKAITSGIIAFAGDVSCQLLALQVVEQEDAAETQRSNETSVTKKMASLTADMDWGRCARFALLGTALIGPTLHYWYGFLHRLLPGTAATTVVKRVALDQLGFAPMFIAVFLSSVMVLDGNAAKIESKLRADYNATLVTNWGYWIPAQIINFRFVAPVYQPRRSRQNVGNGEDGGGSRSSEEGRQSFGKGRRGKVLCSNGFGFFWNIYLSYQSNKAVKDSATPRPPEPSTSHNA